MRKLLLAAGLFFAVAPSFAQNTKWYIAVSPGAGWGGPNGSLKKEFEQRGYNQTSTTVILFVSFGTKYPQASSGVPLTVRGGLQLKPNLNLFAIAGTSSSGEVTGYKNTSNEIATFLGIFGGSIGTFVSIDYKVTQVAVGLEHQMKGSRIKLGYAPAAFLLRYHNIYSSNTGKKTAFVPGVALTGRMPLGKDKRTIGVELIADLNLAPPATIKEQIYTADNGIDTKRVLPATKVNMVHGMVGLALTLRKKKNA